MQFDGELITKRKSVGTNFDILETTGFAPQ